MNRSEDTAPLSDADVRAMVRLLGEVASSTGDHTQKKHQLMDGLCELVNADAWVWALGCQIEENKQPIYVGLTQGGFSEQRFADYLMAIEHPDMEWLTTPFIAELGKGKSQITRLRQQIDKKNRFPKSAAFPLWQKADIGPIILSMRRLDPKSAGTIAVYRSKDAPLFNDRESRIVHIILTEVPWLHEQGWPEDRGVTVPKLSSRLRVILNLLLDGRPRKAIAAHLGLSENTIAGYTKDVYRHFGVNSHAGLMRRFQQGDGGDRVAS